jgi:O-phospho-L-seryl-tRNASec:L-selenocysteinyl-tRNA synthase
MDADNCNVAETLISKTYIQQGSQALAARRRLIKTLLSQRRLPQRGWDDATIELLIQVPARPTAAARALRPFSVGPSSSFCGTGAEIEFHTSL